MGLPSSKLPNSTGNGYQTLQTLAKHQLMTAVAATGSKIVQSGSKPSLADLKGSTTSTTQSKDSVDLNEEKQPEKKTTITTTTLTTTKVKPAAPQPTLQKQASSSSGDFPSLPEKKVPPKPPKRNLPGEQATGVVKKTTQKAHLSKTSSGRTFEKQQTIDEKSSPPLG